MHRLDLAAPPLLSPHILPVLVHARHLRATPPPAGLAAILHPWLAPAPVPPLFWLLLPCLLLPGLLLIRRSTPWRRRRARRVALMEIAAHRDRLRIRRMQLAVADDYGTIDLARWTREKLYFSRTRILPALKRRRLGDQWPALAAPIDRRIERAARPVATPAPPAPDSDPARFDPNMRPADYERHCALLLRQAGWTATVSAAGADQGTDVLARRGARTLVVQCKLYRGAVGNAAVQQISAARLHQRADYAAVVSNARFTESARQLAATNRVHLLHHDELRGFRPD